MKKFNWTLLLAFAAFGVVSCDDDEDVIAPENDEETITNVTLTFSPQGGGDDVVVNWIDADGEGGNNPTPPGQITLAPNTTYDLSIDFRNELADDEDEKNITAEIIEEDDEHMIFFGFTNNLFTDPEGDGNINSRSDAVNYKDQDDNGQPLGLKTEWETGNAASGTFRVLLMHQPGEKSATSTADDGESDVDITFPISIQ
jgi:hypothetical protein